MTQMPVKTSTPMTIGTSARSGVLAKAGMAALIALGSLGAFAASASAQTMAPQQELRHRDPHAARICSPVLAVQKARRGGMRDAHIANITPRRVIVEGRNRHGPSRVVFANVPDCPFLRR
jgi:uncharacterized protein (DUF3084 family)